MLDTNIAIAVPLVRFVYMSDMTAGATARKQAPKKPFQNRHISTVCMSFAAATAKEKMKNPKDAITNGTLLP